MNYKSKLIKNNPKLKKILDLRKKILEFGKQK